MLVSFPQCSCHSSDNLYAAGAFKPKGQIPGFNHVSGCNSTTLPYSTTFLPKSLFVLAHFSYWNLISIIPLLRPTAQTWVWVNVKAMESPSVRPRNHRFWPIPKCSTCLCLKKTDAPDIAQIAWWEFPMKIPCSNCHEPSHDPDFFPWNHSLTMAVGDSLMISPMTKPQICDDPSVTWYFLILLWKTKPTPVPSKQKHDYHLSVT